MLVIGEGGTGKSLLINAIMETFAHYEREATLAKCAPSGIAATQAGGSTIHFWAGLGIDRKHTCYSFILNYRLDN
jgi:predicted GTPase